MGQIQKKASEVTQMLLQEKFSFSNLQILKSSNSQIFKSEKLTFRLTFSMVFEMRPNFAEG